ncbi:MAG: T9SS type A sorting domain-containing protein, partial [Bacteroidota bacterium]|nr:T9SS type A sorting domain-containing protein [Bacteroidota bacterium]
ISRFEENQNTMKTKFTLLVGALISAGAMAQCTSNVPADAIVVVGQNSQIFSVQNQKYWVCGSADSKVFNGSNGQIWIEEGASVSINGNNNTIYYNGSNTFGYTYSSSNLVYVNSMDNFSGAAGNTVIPCDPGGVIFNYDNAPAESCVGVGIDDIDGLQLSMSPNPASDILTIDPGHLIIRSVMIYDLEGREVAIHNSTNPFAIQVGQLDAGTYYIRVVTDQGTVNQRFMKL